MELSDVPYFSQDEYQCGPQSLAMVLAASGVNTTPMALVDDIYVPGRRGSFTPEIQAAARSHARMPYRIDPRLDAILRAVADGYPVLILQNLGLGFAPTWHFAVVIGYDQEENAFVLRTGPHERQVMQTRYFARRWRLADHWGIVLLKPGDFPDWIRRRPYEHQLAYLESNWGPHMQDIYLRLLQRWPDSLLANLGLGNAALARGEPQLATERYKKVLTIEPDNIAALNNLAEAKSRSGDRVEALRLACEAQRLAQGHPLLPAVNATVASLAPHTQNPCSDATSL